MEHRPVSRQYIVKLEETIEVKEDLNLVFTDCDITTNEFNNDSYFKSIDIDISARIESLRNAEETTPKNDENDQILKKNKRKTLMPQRAVQEDGSVGSSINEDFDDYESIFTNLRNEIGANGANEDVYDSAMDEWKSLWGIKCNMCKLVFAYKSEFDTHYKQHYNIMPVYTCAFCNRSLEKYASFRSHCYRHITEQRFKCEECTKGFILQGLLQVHIISKHKKAKPYDCNECSKSFVTKAGLKIHMKRHKGEVTEDYPCAECGKILHTRGGLTSHMNVHRLGRRFMCDVCGKTFTQKVNMQQHVKQHTGDKPYRCDKCGKTFAEKSHLSRHYTFHSEQRPFKCEVCQKMYKTERCLKVHSMVHAKERPYICTYCNKGFLSSTKLKQHYNIHTGERPYACKYCERKFTNYPNWLKHTRRRHNVDHKTGENLPPKIPNKSKTQKQTLKSPHPHIAPLPSVPAATITKVEQGFASFSFLDTEMKLDESDILASVTTDEVLAHDNLVTDFTLSKSEELLLQQGLLNFPLTDDKFLMHQPADFVPVAGSIVQPQFFQPNDVASIQYIH